jgi:DNA-binding IclR family transcriptional regulator
VSTDAPSPRQPLPNEGEKRMLLMSHFSSERPTITAQEFGQLLNLSPATVEDLADFLVRVGCLTRGGSGAYALALHGFSSE